MKGRNEEQVGKRSMDRYNGLPNEPSSERAMSVCVQAFPPEQSHHSPDQGARKYLTKHACAKTKDPFHAPHTKSLSFQHQTTTTTVDKKSKRTRSKTTVVSKVSPKFTRKTHISHFNLPSLHLPSPKTPKSTDDETAPSKRAPLVPSSPVRQISLLGRSPCAMHCESIHRTALSPHIALRDLALMVWTGTRTWW